MECKGTTFFLNNLSLGYGVCCLAGFFTLFSISLSTLFFTSFSTALPIFLRKFWADS